jgi:C1A family cysteine protease
MLSRRSLVKVLASGVGANRLGTIIQANAAPLALSAGSGRGYSVFRFGWLPNLPSVASFLEFRAAERAALPPSVDLRPQMPAVYDQHQIGSCTSNAVAACIQFVRKKNNQPPDVMMSRLFIYYFGRQLANTGDQDSGLNFDSAMSVAAGKGVPFETDWPYDGTPPDDKGKFPSTSRAVAPPRQDTINKAAGHKVTSWQRLPQRLDQLQGCLAQGYPFAFGFTIYKSFFDNNQTPPTAIANIPVPPSIDQPVGGHAVVAVGYDDAKKIFICRNSWGLTDISDRSVEDNGYFYMPYDYITDPMLAQDFVTILAVSG